MTYHGPDLPFLIHDAMYMKLIYLVAKEANTSLPMPFIVCLAPQGQMGRHTGIFKMCSAKCPPSPAHECWQCYSVNMHYD